MTSKSGKQRCRQNSLTHTISYAHVLSRKLARLDALNLGRPLTESSTSTLTCRDARYSAIAGGSGRAVMPQPSTSTCTASHEHADNVYLTVHRQRATHGRPLKMVLHTSFSDARRRCITSFRSDDPKTAQVGFNRYICQQAVLNIVSASKGVARVTHTISNMI